jgi:molecular chaperone GrpE (heat shock protein)
MEANSEIELVQRVALLESRVAALEQSVHPTPQKEEGGRRKEESNPAVPSSFLPSPTQERGEIGVVEEAWRSAPLPLRLRFVQELLPKTHPVQAVLKEAAALEELRAESQALETWIASYPSLFAEAVERLAADVPPGESAAELLAVETLYEARRTLERGLSALGVEWVLPALGTRVTAEMEVVGEEPAPVAPGSIASVRRRGFRQRGALVLPAQVVRALPMRENHGEHGETRRDQEARTLNNQPPTASDQPLATSHQPPAEAWPEWLRTFLQRSTSSDNVVVRQWANACHQAVAAVLQAATDTVLAERLALLLPLFGARHVESQFALPPPWGEVLTEARNGMLDWLRSVAGIELVAPSPGEPFDAATMQAVGVRRTAHPHENNTIARVEQVGLRRGAMPLFRAQVVRYELESGL